jgi:hypothetical protein
MIRHKNYEHYDESILLYFHTFRFALGWGMHTVMFWNHLRKFDIYVHSRIV